MQYSNTWFLNGHRISLLRGLLLPSVLCLGCGGPAPLTVDMPLHLEDHLDVATIVGSEVPEDVPATVEWRFDESQPDWKPAPPRDPSTQRVKVSRTVDALRMIVREPHRGGPTTDFIRYARDGIYIDLPDWNREDWAYVDVRARASGGVAILGIGFNLPEGDLKAMMDRGVSDRAFAFLGTQLFSFFGEQADVFNDGSVQTYRMRADWSWRSQFWEGPWKQLGVLAQARRVSADEPATIDILSVSVIPKDANYVAGPVGVRTEVRNQAYRRALYTHAPGRLEYRVRIPRSGRLDVGLGVLRDDAPVTFRISAAPGGGGAETLLEETYADQKSWAQRSVDLSGLAGQTVTLALEADAERPGTVALWAAPTLSGAPTTDKLNIIFYIIDGAGADHMSVYGYNRRTTPNLERLAAEGAVFEHAYSNSSSTPSSTPSFMSSLQHSVFGGSKNLRSSPPPEVLTMAEHLHRAGYQTAVFTTNAFAGSSSNLDRGVDVLRDAAGSDLPSSVQLHDDFWRWREVYPAEPYWVHFQTTDVHSPNNPVAPFAGLFVSPELQETYREWDRQLLASGGHGPHSEAFEKTGIDRRAYFGVARDLYDETMAHQDYQIGQLVERLKAAGEWEHTLLIVAADHGTMAGAGNFGLGLLDPLPPNWVETLLSSFVTRIPMIFVWPARIAPGQRFSQPVSMIDMLPTILELADLPEPEVMQGQSLAPLLLGEDGWEPRPVILDEFKVDADTGELHGTIEVVDGRWGASLEINPEPPEEDEDEEAAERRRPVPLLLYDLWNDPMALWSVHEERPDLVEKYTEFLEAQWEAHQSLAQLFTRSGEVALTPEQLRTLRALGYIQ